MGRYRCPRCGSDQALDGRDLIPSQPGWFRCFRCGTWWRVREVREFHA
ncbi:MAG: hypothetical protein JRD89_04465 [Deltaproteobacteria bacterium]|nr:hypothetical protein [Deltaproteobacteria bacterium]